MVHEHGDPGGRTEPPGRPGVHRLRVRPQVQADIAEWVNYVTPVTGVKEILRKRDPALRQEQTDLPEPRVHHELQL